MCSCMERLKGGRGQPSQEAAHQAALAISGKKMSVLRRLELNISIVIATQLQCDTYLEILQSKFVAKMMYLCFSDL